MITAELACEWCKWTGDESELSENKCPDCQSKVFAIEPPTDIDGFPINLK